MPFSIFDLETPVLSLLGPQLTSVNPSLHDLADISHLSRLNIPVTGLQTPLPPSSSLETVSPECDQNLIDVKASFALSLYEGIHYLMNSHPLCLGL